MKKTLLFVFIVLSYPSLCQNLSMNFLNGQLGFGYLGGCTDPNSICWVGPNLTTWAPNSYNSNTAVQMKGTHGCIGSPFWTQAGLIFGARNNQGQTGDGMAIVYNFKKGYTYTISATAYFSDKLYDPTHRNYSNYPTLQFQVTNSLITGNFCTVSALPINIFSSTNPYFSMTYNGGPSSASFMFTAQNCYTYLWIASLPNTQQSDGVIDFRTLSITEQGQYAISGPSPLCSGSGTYSLKLNNVLVTAPITWSVSPSGYASLSTSNNKAILSYQTPGQVTLKATYNACGTQVVYNKTINLGIPDPVQSIDIYGNGADDPLNLCPGGYRAEAVTTKTYPQFEWLLPTGWTSSVSGGNNPFIVGTTGFDIPVSVSHLNNPALVRVRTINSCGYSSPVFLTVGTNCERGKVIANFIVSPNPATGSVRINSSMKNKTIKEIQLVDKIGYTVRTAKYSTFTQIVNFNISGISPDIYYIKIYDGHQWESTKLKIQGSV